MKGRTKVSHLEQPALSVKRPGQPASAVIGEEFAGFGIRLGVFGQGGGIFSHSLSSHPEEFQVNRDWPVFWSARRNLLV